MIKKILVAGATGRTGRLIIEKLLHQGIKPRALVRDLTEAQALWGDAVDCYPGDVRDTATLLPAASGMDALVSAIGASSPVGKNCPKRVDYEGVANLVEAAGASGVKRFILISSIAVTRPDHPMNCFGNILKWKFKGEEALRGSSMDYGIIRPGGLKDTPGGQRQLAFSQGDKVLGMVSRSDLAEISLQALQYSQSLRVTFEVIEAEPMDIRQAQLEFTALAMD
jgi:uncharacterized protein YbjT (DUF2867 family)